MKPVVDHPIRRLNSFGRNQRKTIDQIFLQEVVPSIKDKFSLSRHDCQRYVVRRNRSGADEELLPDRFRFNGAYAYELLLHDFFWNQYSTHFASSRLLLIEGQVGIGKTTFLHYYLRSFCLQRNPVGFRRKIIVIFNARHCVSLAKFETNLSQSIEAAVTRYLKANSYKRFCSQMPLAANSTSIQEYLNRTKRFLDTVSECVGQEFYLCFVFDNLDQVSDKKIIEESFSIINHLLEDTGLYDVWKIVVTLWPDTFNYLRGINKTVMTDDKFCRIKLPPVSKRHLAIRQRHAKKFLRKQILNAPESESIAQFDYKMFSIKFKRLMKLIKKCDADLEKMSFFDNRIYNEHIRNLFISKYAEEMYTYTKKKTPYGTTIKEWSNYSFWDCVIKGEYNFHSSETSYVWNLFDPLAKLDIPTSPLGAFHLLYVIKQEARVSEARAVDLCASIGHDQKSLWDILSVMRSHNFYHRVGQAHGDTYIEPHWEVLDWYFRAASKPYYVDNMALVTPIPDSYHADMSESIFYEEGDFERKCITTIRFIEYIRDREIEFGSEYEFPYLWERMSLNYVNRLKGLKRSYVHLTSISTSSWKRIFEEKIIRDATVL